MYQLHLGRTDEALQSLLRAANGTLKHKEVSLRICSFVEPELMVCMFYFVTDLMLTFDYQSFPHRLSHPEVVDTLNLRRHCLVDEYASAMVRIVRLTFHED